MKWFLNALSRFMICLSQNFYESFKWIYHNSMKLKKSFLNRLFENRQLSDYQKKLVAHGLDIFINDVRNYLIIILLSVFFDSIINAIYFIVSFSVLRIHCGGYHAPTKAKCCLTFTCIYLLFLLFTSAAVHGIILFIISMIAASYIIANAPMEHIHNRLSEKEIKRNKTTSAIVSIVLFLVGSLIMIIGFDCFKAPYYSLISNSFLMMILKHSKNWRYYNGN